MKLIVALGGNALGQTPVEQKQLVEKTADAIVDLIEQGHNIVLTHGNGPQVGMINLAFFQANTIDGTVPLMPFPECGAMSQGYIGYHLQNALCAKLAQRKIEKDVLSVVTQVVVDENDEGFVNPTKPIGAFMDEGAAKEQERSMGYVMKQIGNKWRRVVASPKPIDIVEKSSISTLIEAGAVVITVGGGGIPVVKSQNGYHGVDAVIDKDYASALLARQIGADMLVILTAVDKVSINFAKPNEIKLDRLNAQQCQQYIDEGQFGKGSMLPKVNACLDFVQKGGKAIIASLENCALALCGKSGTLIEKE